MEILSKIDVENNEVENEDGGRKVAQSHGISCISHVVRRFEKSIVDDTFIRDKVTNFLIPLRSFSPPSSSRQIPN